MLEGLSIGDITCENLAKEEYRNQVIPLLRRYFSQIDSAATDDVVLSYARERYYEVNGKTEEFKRKAWDEYIQFVEGTVPIYATSFVSKLVARLRQDVAA